MSTEDETFAALLDAHGILRADAVLPAPAPAYVVFSQRSHAGLDEAALRANAERYFGTTVGFTVRKRFPEGWPERDAVRVVVAPSAIAGGVRLALGGPTDASDLDRADAADLRAGRAGMFDLARRCPTVWHVERLGEDDRTALLLAAVLSTTLLGPIFDGERLFAVRTARSLLEAPARAYR
jgi:hypothetical protein